MIIVSQIADLLVDKSYSIEVSNIELSLSAYKSIIVDNSH